MTDEDSDENTPITLELRRRPARDTTQLMVPYPAIVTAVETSEAKVRKEAGKHYLVVVSWLMMLTVAWAIAVGTLAAFVHDDHARIEALERGQAEGERR